MEECTATSAPRGNLFVEREHLKWKRARMMQHFCRMAAASADTENFSSDRWKYVKLGPKFVGKMGGTLVDRRVQEFRFDETIIKLALAVKKLVSIMRTTLAASFSVCHRRRAIDSHFVVSES
jgi:hypothetical protein